MATEQKETHATPGNSGAWYLELVGVEVPQELRDTNGNGNGSVGQLWDQTGGSDILDGWTPEALNSTAAGSRTFRWTVVGALLIAGIAAVVALLVLPSFVENQARTLNDDYRQALLELNAELAPTQLVLERATDPVDTIEDLAAASRTLSDLTESATAVSDLAAEALPRSLPFIPRDALAELQPARDKMIEVGAIGNELARRITNTAEYETDASALFDIPRLPTVANDVRIADLSVELAAIQATSAATLAALPDDAALEAHKSAARTVQERFTTWQAEYLDALRNRDQSTARALINEMADRRDALADVLVDAKATIRSDLDGSLVTLADQIEATLILLPR